MEDVSASFIMLLNFSFLNKILDTATLLASVLTDLSSCQISPALSFRLLSLDNSLVPT